MSFLFSKHGYRSMKHFAVMLFFMYMVILCYLLFLSPGFGRTGTIEQQYNLIPFKTIGNYIRYRNHVNRSILWINLLGNVVAFVPMGFFVPVLFRQDRSLTKVILFAAVTSTAAECLQYVLMVGSFDVDDVILNTLGGVCGYLCFWHIRGCYYRRREKSRDKIAARGGNSYGNSKKRT